MREINQKSFRRTQDKKLAISMRGGMARALSYIGVLRALEEEGIQIDYMIGASMGGLIAGAYSLGFSVDNLSEFFREYKLTSMFNIQSLSGISILAEKKVRAKIHQYLGDQDLSDAKIKTWIQLTDIDNGESVKMGKGDISDLIVATIAYPFLVRPVMINDNAYIDGGVTGTWEVEFLKSQGADIVMGLDPGETFHRSRKGLINRIIAPINIASQRLREIDLRYNPLDILISNIGGEFGYSDFQKVDELAEIGYRRMKEKMPELKELLVLE